jgi:hypothetical protein
LAKGHHADLTTRRRELDRVAQQIHEDLLHGPCIPLDEEVISAELPIQLDPLGIGVAVA